MYEKKFQLKIKPKDSRIAIWLMNMLCSTPKKEKPK